MFDGILRQIVRCCGIAAIKKPAGSDLANAGYEQFLFVLPHAGNRYPADVEVHVFYARIFSPNRVHKYRQGGVGCVVVATASGKMRDLLGDVRSLRK